MGNLTLTRQQQMNKINMRSVDRSDAPGFLKNY